MFGKKLFSVIYYIFVTHRYCYYIYLQTPVDSLCMYRAILQQIEHPESYTPVMLRKQVVYHMTKNTHFYRKYLAQLFRRNHQNIHSYLLQIENGEIFGDHIVLGAIGRMFNVSITIVSPFFHKPWNIFHKSTQPDIILVANGGDFLSNHRSTHISATGSVYYFVHIFDARKC